MLRKCTDEEFYRYADFVYELALDRSRSGYPTYTDGIKTKEMFIERSEKGLKRDTEEIVLFEHEGTVEGWIHYYWLPEDNYIATTGFYIAEHTEEAMEQFIELVKDRFSGYDLYLGFSTDNQKAVGYLSDHGFECIENSFNNTLYVDKYQKAEHVNDVIRISENNYELFRWVHSQIDGDMYWNSDRILDDIDDWMLLVKLRDRQPVGAIYYTGLHDDDKWCEIFGLDIDNDVFDEEIFNDLMGQALNTVKDNGGIYVTMFCERREQEHVGKFGFECIGEYVCYKKHVD